MGIFMATEMNKSKIRVLLLTLLISLASTFAVSANAQTGIVSVKFRGYAEGECFFGYGNPGPGTPLPYDWWGIGKGSVGLNGHAEALPLETSGTWLEVLGDAFISESLNARGTVTLSWLEEDSSKNQLAIMLYSDASTHGIFMPESGYFSVPLGGPDAGAVALKFKGYRIVDHVIQKMEGIAALGSMPIGLSPANPNISPFRGIGLAFVDLLSGKGFIAMWSSDTLELPIYGQGPGPTILVLAAKTLQSIVEVKGK